MVSAMLATTTVCANAADCHIPLTVASISEGEIIPDGTADLINTRLQSIINSSDAVAGTSLTNFFIAAKMNHVSKDLLPGPPRQTAIVSELTLYIGDFETQTVYASTTLQLRGVGNSEQRALTSALRPLNAGNEKIEKFISGASDKILAYYDKHYDQILTKAARAAGLQHYDEAIALAFSIPECCTGYAKATDAGLKYYQKLIDTDGRKLYETARSLWIASPDSYGASQALPILLSIPLGSDAYAESEKLVKEIYSIVKDDKEFETRTKYEDEQELKKLKIRGATSVGVAWGQGQQPTTTNINWIK